MNDRVNWIKIGLRMLVFYTTLFSVPVPVNAQTGKIVNLLSDAHLESDQSVLGSNVDEKLLRDGEAATVAQFTATASKSIELVYSFGDTTVVPQQFQIQTANLKADQARVEILVSTISAEAGYRSLRSEPLRASSQSPQTFTFDQTGAKWVMIKFTPFASDTMIPISEMSLNGYAGAPSSVYKFDESPTAAIEVLSKLKNSVDVTFSEDEASLFKDAADGSLDQWSFAEAALLSSGVTDSQQRKGQLEKIDQLESVVKKTISTDLPAFERGKQLLDLLHQQSLTGGYQKLQTDVSTLLEQKTFNCVSSATIYNILARRIGLDVRGIEVPDHAFSILYDGTNHADIETTNKRGFNPARDRAGLNDFQRQTGFSYIPDANRSKRRELGESGMVALTYYNHGVTLTETKQYPSALVSYFKALSLDPDNNSAVKNVLAVLATWSHQLVKEDNLDQALSVLAVGLELAPKDRTILHNNKVTWQRKAEQALAADDTDQALQHLTSAFEQTNDDEFLRLQSWVYLSSAQKKAKLNDWSDALAVAEQGLAKVDEPAKREIRKWIVNLILRWSNDDLEKKNFAEAITTLENGSKHAATDYRVRNNLAFAVQEWCKEIRDTKGPDAGRELAATLGERFSGNRPVQTVLSSFIGDQARAMIEAGDFEGAIDAYAAARKDRPDDSRLKRNEEATWIKWANPLMKARDWKQALEIYEKAFAAHPKTFVFQQNITFIVQEWSRDVAEKEGIVAAEEIISRYAEKLPNVSGVKRMKGSQVSSAIRKSVKAKDYPEAEELLADHKDLFASESKFNQLLVFVYHQHAKEHLDKKEWDQAIEIFSKGQERHPSSRGIKDNLVFSWNSLAQESLDKKEWQTAIDIYARALKSVPGNRTFLNNQKYCESKLKELSQIKEGAEAK